MANEFKAEESMAHESMADEFKPKESKGDDHGAVAYIVYEILKYRKIRNGCNIYGGEILKFRRTYDADINRKIVAAVRQGGLAPACPIKRMYPVSVDQIPLISKCLPESYYHNL